MAGMCGRYTLKTPPVALADLFGLASPPEVTPRFNVAPTQMVLCVRQQDGIPAASMLKWGLIPSWADDPSIGNRLINARSETAAAKPAFRSAFKRRRCLIAADGFYEWQKLDSRRKQPWYFQLRDEEPFAFAGLWETWRDPEGTDVATCTILTTDANDVVAPVHDRMPVILPPERCDLWLDSAIEGGAQLRSLLAPSPAREMTAAAVSSRVNSPKNEGPELIVPADEPS